MKINKEQVINMLVALGFKKAPEWPDDTLKDRVGKIPQKVAEDEVPAEFAELYDKLQHSPADEPILWDTERAKKKKAAAPAETENKDMKKKTKKTTKRPSKKPAAKKPAAKKVAKKKTARKPAAKKTAGTGRSSERDYLGSCLGTKGAEINEALKAGGWVTDSGLKKQTGASMRRVRGHLYNLVQEGHVVKERLIRYRLAPKKGKK